MRKLIPPPLNTKFGLLTVISGSIYKPYPNKNRCFIRVKCDCGNEKEIYIGSILKGFTTSCGCVHRAMVRKNFTTHGLTNHPLYSVYRDMINRCYRKNRPAYKWYGAKGVKVCDEWRNDFMSFYNWAIENGYKKGLVIHRYCRKLGDYEPSNCKWVTQKENLQDTITTKLNNDLAEEIRILYAMGGIFQWELGLIYGVNKSKISSVINYKTWA